MSGASFFNSMFADAGRIFTDSFGDTYAITLPDGQIVNVGGILSTQEDPVMVNDDGMAVMSTSIRLDLRRDEVRAAGIEYYEDVGGSFVTVENRDYRIGHVDDDMKAFLRCKLHTA
jgi:hypothetical protein